MKYYVIIPCNGVGSRMGTQTPKQYLPLNGKMVIDHVLSLFLNHSLIEKVVIVASDGEPFLQKSEYRNHPKLLQCEGGATRAHTVHNGIQALNANKDDWVIVHDAARPCLDITCFEKLIEGLKDNAVGGLLASPMPYTLKQVKENQVSSTLDRSTVWAAMTPQMFRFGLLHKALGHALALGSQITDDSQAIEALGHQPLIVEGKSTNIKITTIDDLELAGSLLTHE